MKRYTTPVISLVGEASNLIQGNQPGTDDEPGFGLSSLPSNIEEN
ncbi:MAG TPA: hypothetical protein VHQ22_15875 [Terriglobales bacterium]|nr:hypothetical protein [Terriglobales bacterium]